MSEDIWNFLSKGAEPDDWYTADIRLRRHRDGGGGPVAVLQADSRTNELATDEKKRARADLDNYVRAFKRIAFMEDGQ